MSDFQGLLSALQNAFNDALPFVAYKKPHKTRIKALIQSNNELHSVTENIRAGFVFAPFNAEKKAVLIPIDEARMMEARFEDTPVNQSDKPLPKVQNNDRWKHLNNVDAAISYINSGQAEKIVISRKEIIELPAFSFTETFDRLLKKYANAFVYVWYHPDVGLWLGATPELLISVNDTSFKTVSLAGTQPFTNTLHVVWGSKEREEQQIVTDYLKSNLKPVVHTFSISEAQTVKAGNVLHLQSEIVGILKRRNDIAKLIKLIHPSPAVCGVPKESAKQFILTHEGYDREYYTGYLGEMNIDNCTDLYVNLRCMKYESSRVALFLGGGITKDSISENEWYETVEKSQVIKKVL